VRNGVVICVGSNPLAATSTNIGVKSHEFLSPFKNFILAKQSRGCTQRSATTLGC
jgi:hypothetical protein